MPLFEYRCGSCENEFEALVRNGEKPACPSCESESLTRLLSVAAAHANGSASAAMPQACPPSDAPPCSPHCCRL